MKKKVLAFVLTSCMALSLLTGCGGDSATGSNSGSGDAASTKSINVAIAATEAAMDPIMAADSVYVTLLGNIIGGLYTVDTNNQLQLDLAESVTQSEDGLVYTFKLRDTSWSNGTPLTANDFVFAWRRLADPTSGTQFAYMVEECHIKNGGAVTAGEMAPEELGVKALDDHTLEVTLETATPYFASITAFSAFAPLNEEFVTAQGDQFAMTKDNLIYCGAFTLADWDVSGNTITLAKNPNYWDADNVDLDEVNFQLVPDTQQGVMSYENGDLDRITLSGDLVGQYAASEDFSSALGVFNWYLYFNDATVPNETLRQAIAYSIDREDLVNNVLKDGSVAQHNILMTGLYTSASTGEDFNTACGSHYDTNKAKAKELWAQAQTETDMNSLTLMYEEDDASVGTVAAYIQSEIETTLDGFSVELQCLPKKSRIQNMQDGTYQVALHRWGPDYSDASCIMSLYSSNSPYNYAQWANADYDALMDACTTTLATDPDARWDAYVEAEHILADSAVCVPLYQVGNAVLTRSGVNGITNHITGISCYYKYVTVD